MKIGFLSMPLTGHLHRMTALGRKTQARGHEVVFFGLPDAAPIVLSAGLDFVPFGEEEYPVGTTPAMYARLATLKGEDVVRYSFQEMHPRRARITLEQLPEKLVHGGVEALIIPVGFDQPGIAARIVYHGVGKSVPVASINKEDLSGAIEEVLGNPTYQDRARCFQKTIAQTQGLDRAADVLERAFFSSGRSRNAQANLMRHLAWKTHRFFDQRTTNFFIASLHRW